MPLDPALIPLLSAPSTPPLADMALRRQAFAADFAAVDQPGPVMLREEELKLAGAGHNLPARLFWPETAAAVPPLLVFFHGGGWIQGSIATHASLCRYLAHHGHMAVLSVEYRLAPEHPFPAPVEDAAAALNWAYDNRDQLGVGQVLAGGDSAGGNLAAAACLMAHDQKKPLPQGLLLLYPALDLAAQTDSRQEFGKGYWLDTLDEITALYVPDTRQRLHPYASPGRAESLAMFPPTLVVTAGYDPLRDEAVDFARRLIAAKVSCSTLHEAKMIHGFLSLHGFVDSARQSLVRCAKQWQALVSAAGDGPESQ